MPDLPDGMPTSMARLPVNKVGYPVPWFVWFDPETGEPDFRVMRPSAVRDAVQQNRCWVCGDHIVGKAAFVIGPMCAVNRTSAEPPSHILCARWSAKACPFLARPSMNRRDIHKDFEHAYVPGTMIERNPGVTLVWPTRRGQWSLFSDPNGGTLFDIGDALGTPEWYAHSREATRAEVEHSIDTGIPLLQKIAEEEGPDAVDELTRRRLVAQDLLPA